LISTENICILSHVNPPPWNDNLESTPISTTEQICHIYSADFCSIACNTGTLLFYTCQSFQVASDWANWSIGLIDRRGSRLAWHPVRKFQENHSAWRLWNISWRSTDASLLRGALLCKRLIQHETANTDILNENHQSPQVILVPCELSSSQHPDTTAYVMSSVQYLLWWWDRSFPLTCEKNRMQSHWRKSIFWGLEILKFGQKVGCPLLWWLVGVTVTMPTPGCSVSSSYWYSVSACPSLWNV